MSEDTAAVTPVAILYGSHSVIYDTGPTIYYIASPKVFLHCIYYYSYVLIH